MTGGRAIFGVGAGAPWNIAPAGPGPEMSRVFEAEGLGIPFPSLAERFERLEELLQIAHQMWRGDESPYQGRHYQLVRPLNSPNSVQRPHPPILIGGSGERKTLRMVAQYADACNLFDIPDGGRTVTHKLTVLAGHCADLGRPYAQIEKTLSTRLEAGETSDAFARRCEAAAALGIEHMVVLTSSPWTAEALSTLAAAITTLRQAGSPAT
jgi:alkanesulfonate monooxygenase SsuD/methylene tetrahydromethanopterin reductase-like flavin-dependent oxidoreductase (luciferase family)